MTEEESTRERDGTVRVEDPALLCGQGRFLDDLDPLPGTLVAAIVRSPYPHARIAGFDASVALASPGVTAVIGPRDVTRGLRPFPLSVRTPMPYYAAATDRVRFVGEPVAVVVAADRYLAEDAAELVDVDYDELPAVTGTRAALADDAPRLHRGGGQQRGDRPDVQLRPRRAGLRRSRPRGQRRLLLPPVLLHAARVLLGGSELDRDADGAAVEAWANFHGPFSMIPVIAGALGLPAARLRLHVPADIGGSFGIKAGIYPYVALMALASKHAGAPVRWTEDRLEHSGRVLGGRRPARCGSRPRSPPTGSITGAPGRPDRQRRRLPAPARAVHAVPVLRQHHRRLPHPGGAHPGPRRGHQQGAHRAEPRVRRPAAVLRPGAADGQDRRARPAWTRPRRGAGTSSARTRSRTRTPTGGVYDSGDYRQAFDLALKNADYDALRAEQARGARPRASTAASGWRRSSTRRRPTSATSGWPRPPRSGQPGAASPARPSSSGSASTRRRGTVMLGTCRRARATRPWPARWWPNGSACRSSTFTPWSRWTPRRPRGRSPRAATRAGSRRC